MLWDGGTIAAVSGGVGAVAGAISTMIAARFKSEPDVKAVTNAAVAGIIQHYTEALAAQTKEVYELRSEIAELRLTVEAQNQEIAELNNHIIDLSSALDRHGIVPPPRRRALALD